MVIKELRLSEVVILKRSGGGGVDGIALVAVVWILPLDGSFLQSMFVV